VLLFCAFSLFATPAKRNAVLVGRVLDGDTGQEIPCTVVIQSGNPSSAVEGPDSTGRFYSAGEFRKTVSPGQTTITVSRGFDYLGQQRNLELKPGERLQLVFRLRRQAHLRRLGWYCGDNHVHMFHGPGTPPPGVDFPYVALVARAAGLDYLSIAQNWNLPPSAITPTHLSELCKSASTPDFILAWNMEAPKNYCRGDTTHCVGHCWFVGIKRSAPDGQDVIHELDRMSAADYQSDKTPTPNFESHALIHSLGGIVAYTHPCRWWWGDWGGQGIYPAEVGKFVSNLAQELPYDTVVGPTYDAMDILMQSWDQDNYVLAQRLWFLLLNKGYRIAGTASTDSGFDKPENAQPGIVRVYTQVPGSLDTSSVAQAMKAGRNFVTSGPLLLLEIGGHSVGDIVHITQPADFQVSLQAWPSGVVGEHLSRVELLRNGTVVKRFGVGGQEQKFVANFNIRENGTAWYIARCFGSNHLQVAITNPVYFEGRDYRPPQATLARVIANVTDASTGKPLNGECEIVRMVGLTGVLVSTRHFTDGHFTLEMPGTARLRVRVQGYEPMAKSVFMDFPPLLQMTLNMREAELTDWRTFEEIRRLLGNVQLEFPLARAN
jgi:hypothetical protein